MASGKRDGQCPCGRSARIALTETAGLWIECPHHGIYCLPDIEAAAMMNRKPPEEREARLVTILEDQRAKYLDYVRRSFRDMADGDYIAARILHRQGLLPQFLWSAHQAVEKYIKGILLFSDADTREIGHDLERGLELLAEIRDISFEIPNNVREFVAYLNLHGPNRYFEYTVTTLGRELLWLDRSVWYLRRYCYWMRGTARTRRGPIERLPHEIAHTNAFDQSNAHRLRLPGGHLEKVLADKDSPLRRQLVWKNFYFGSRRRRAIRHFKEHIWSANPATVLYPDIFPLLAARVRFSAPFRKAILARIRKERERPRPEP